MCVCCETGWQLGEHQEWAKFSNFRVATNVPLLVYVPGVSHRKMAKGHTFPFVNPFKLSKTSDETLSDTSLYDHGKNGNLVEKFSQGGKKALPYGSFVEGGKMVRYETNALVELVDLFPTLADLAGLEAVPQCPVPSSDVDLCTEGHSFAPVIHNVTATGNSVQQMRWKNATFTQYPRPSSFPGRHTDNPNLRDIKIMGYSMRTPHYRYAEWVEFNKTSFSGNWDKVYARELYVYEADPREDHNVAKVSQYAWLVKKASALLHTGWKGALPPAVLL